MVAIDLSKQKVLHGDPRASQQINFTGNLNRAGNTTMFHSSRSKRNCLKLFTRNCKSIVNVLQNDLIFINKKQLSTIV